MNTAPKTASSSVVYLPSTSRGLVGKYIRNTIFLVAGAIGAGMLNYASNSLAEQQPTMQDIIERYDRGEISRRDYDAAIEKSGERQRNINSRNEMSDSDRQNFSWLLFGAACSLGLVALGNGKGLIDNN